MHVVGWIYEGLLEEDSWSEYGEFRWVDGRIFKEVWKNGIGHSAILVCILIFIFDKLIFNWKFNKVKFTWLLDKVKVWCGLCLLCTLSDSTSGLIFFRLSFY